LNDTLADWGEQGLIKHIRQLFPKDNRLHVGIGDDAAVLDLNNPLIVVATDTMVEGIHFQRDMLSPLDVGKRLVNVNVSDIAAMGAAPKIAVLNISAPSSLEVAWLQDCLAGIAQTAKLLGTVIVGGDVTGSPGPIFLSMSVVGELAGEKPLQRSGAQPGDGIYVTGTLGGAALGLTILDSAPQRAAEYCDSIARFQVPPVRLEEGVALGEWGFCNALMDLSDGLGADAARMALESQTDLVVELTCVPFHPDLQRWDPYESEKLALFGGEDYELLFTCDRPPPITATRIGEVREGSGMIRWERNGSEVTLHAPNKFDHFSV
jgi:thiamine-monophosphate kinase